MIKLLNWSYFLKPYKWVYIFCIRQEYLQLHMCVPFFSFFLFFLYQISALNNPEVVSMEFK